MDWHWDDHEHQALDERVVQRCAVSAPIAQGLVLAPAPAPLPRMRHFRVVANAPRFVFAQPHAPPRAAGRSILPAPGVRARPAASWGRGSLRPLSFA